MKINDIINKAIEEHDKKLYSGEGLCKQAYVSYTYLQKLINAGEFEKKDKYTQEDFNVLVDLLEKKSKGKYLKKIVDRSSQSVFGSLSDKEKLGANYVCNVETVMSEKSDITHALRENKKSNGAVDEIINVNDLACYGLDPVQVKVIKLLVFAGGTSDKLIRWVSQQLDILPVLIVNWWKQNKSFRLAFQDEYERVYGLDANKRKIIANMFMEAISAEFLRRITNKELESMDLPVLFSMYESISKMTRLEDPDSNKEIHEHYMKISSYYESVIDVGEGKEKLCEQNPL